ncbi:SDR family NAD(P)-dependent oxidoreductase [Marinobacterium rhizophilum]|uniref:SDR family oxidoreductase n=1 Tax=Marinobacterium rhizophilum TaxID=420402 RepID=A0ABY5HH83_9GAMM|nr:SDR family oxidoreductase [Marinobacterium rhizophilum]UTW11197.1 SDR family oxidoreductase [Marinobacterium rhizophilum]
MSTEYSRYPSLQDRTVFITGGATGIGASMVEHFVAQGSKVCFVDIDQQAASELCARLAGTGSRDPLFIPCDLTDIAALQQAIATASETLGPIRVLVNNAARDTRYAFKDIDVAAWDAMQAVNLRHVFFACQAVHDGMAASGGGSIINFSSPSFMRRSANISPYATAKAGTIGLTRTLSRDLGHANIRVNTVLPGWVITPRQKDLWWDAKLEQDVLANQSLHQKLEPDDVSRMVLFLAADDSRMITAQTYIVDGGLV